MILTALFLFGLLVVYLFRDMNSGADLDDDFDPYDELVGEDDQ